MKNSKSKRGLIFALIAVAIVIAIVGISLTSLAPSAEEKVASSFLQKVFTCSFEDAQTLMTLESDENASTTVGITSTEDSELLKYCEAQFSGDMTQAGYESALEQRVFTIVMGLAQNAQADVSAEKIELSVRNGENSGEFNFVVHLSSKESSQASTELSGSIRTVSDGGQIKVDNISVTRK
ncbi:hypothetical protein [Fournierella sp.]|uniref:hypothetical protein n=1 Tax=Allofournierella sp. TaxID=1940256 RepID=UPI00307AF43D